MHFQALISKLPNLRGEPELPSSPTSILRKICSWRITLSTLPCDALTPTPANLGSIVLAFLMPPLPEPDFFSLKHSTRLVPSPLSVFRLFL